MDKLEIAKNALAEIEKGAIAASTYTDDMTFELSGAAAAESRTIPGPHARGLVGAAPDWNFHARDFRVEGDTVHINIGITGTQTRTLSGLMPGMPSVPPTGKQFSLPGEHLDITVRGDKISRVVAQVPPGGGVPGLLKQLGVPLPG